MARVLELDEIDGEEVGGKAAGLARLVQMELRVPRAVVLVEATPGGPLPDLEALISRLGGGPLAVRSSALGEDGEQASFAGQYDTVLGVLGAEALGEAIEACLASADADRARAYRIQRGEGDGDGAAESQGASETGTATMSIVVQRLVDARVSGVCFTVDPVTHRRNRLVLDAVSGLGEALVSGHAHADHEELLREEWTWAPSQPAGDGPVLTPDERDRIAREALEAEEKAGAPLDLEWAIDRAGEIQWLQARPITTLGLDPQCLDTALGRPGEVHTRCNVGEMMPGAVAPLTYSTCARGIDEGWNRIKRAVGVPVAPGPEGAYLAMSHGHLFINLSEGVRFSTAVSGASPDQQSLAICGRIVPEIEAPPVPSLLVRLPRLFRQLALILRPRPRLRRLEALVADAAISSGESALASWQRIDARMPELFEAYALHLLISSAAGALAPILLGRLAGGEEPSDEHHAIVAAVLSGADGVESADIAEGAERVLEALVESGAAAEPFLDEDAARAARWLEGDSAGEAGRRYRAYLSRHGHRSLRELDIRQPEWAHDPTPLVRSLQSQLRGQRSAPRVRVQETPPPPAGVERFDRIRPLAHAAVRNRERSKSLLVALTVHFKAAYRALGRQLVEEGRLPDPDAVYFLLHEEIEALARGEAPSLAALAVERRGLLDYQRTLRFPEVQVGRPQPEPRGVEVLEDGVLVGKPVSRGCVEGRVRVVERLEDAEALEPGDILVAPITDVGWTPYFAVIGGLVTDVGSAVSHGAVVAREYGLPAVLNTRTGTQSLRTGEWVRLDGDRGTVERIAEPQSEATG